MSHILVEELLEHKGFHYGNTYVIGKIRRGIRGGIKGGIRERIRERIERRE